jgi:TetR/AcrR family tetracycline transcriptional repressor
MVVSKDTDAHGRLGPDKIVASALAIADAEGLPAVTIRRLAQHHNVTPMALYRHFRDKDELLDAVVERVLADVALPEPSGGPWYEQMRDVLAAFLAAIRPHPNTAGLTITRILASEPGLALAERTLGLLGEAGFPTDQAAEIASQAVCSLVTLVTTEPGSSVDSDPEARDDAIRAKRASLAALSPRRYPHVIAAADALTQCANRKTYYELGVDLVVAGMRGVRSDSPV